MKEDFLHYIWKYQKINTLQLKTVQNNTVTILHPGIFHELAGPDFFNAQVTIDGQKWAGNIEVHVKSSDWYVHHHERDDAYNNVILHVVWEYDTAVYGPDNTEIPVLELQSYLAPDLIVKYHALLSPKSWIYCQNTIGAIDPFVWSNWQERLFFERLERKSQFIFDSLSQTNNDWEAVFFISLAKNFGLNTNGDSFCKIAQSIPFSVVRKETSDLQNLEALLFGMGGLLEQDKEDVYYKDLQFRFYYLLQKHALSKPVLAPLQFFKHRPDNFPTIRLAQLAALYHMRVQLFSTSIHEFSLLKLYQQFAVTPSKYWDTHYQFDKESPRKSKKISTSFIELVLINTVIPIQFAYARQHGKEISEDLVSLMRELSPEKNAIVDKFKSYGVSSSNAFQTQALLQLKTEYCQKNKCFQCAVGDQLLKT